MVGLQKELHQKKKYPPEDWPLSKQWATRAIYRAHSGFYFLKDSLEKIYKGGTDPVYSRSLYILLSFHCELLLTAYLLVLLKDECPQKTERDLMDMLKGKNNHDLKDLSEKIGKKNLKNLGIENVKLETKNDLKRYIINLADNKKIIIEDLITVRYDFKYDKLRDFNANESDEINQGVVNLLKMTTKVIKMLPNNPK